MTWRRHLARTQGWNFITAQLANIILFCACLRNLETAKTVTSPNLSAVNIQS